MKWLYEAIAKVINLLKSPFCRKFHPRRLPNLFKLGSTTRTEPAQLALSIGAKIIDFSRLSTFATASFLLLALTACHKKQSAPTPPSYPVKTGMTVQKEAPIFIEALGHVDPIISISISSRVEGEIVGIHFTQGQEVKKGDLLITIDPRPYEAALKAAKATLDQNMATLTLAHEKVKRYKVLTQDEYYSQIDYETLQANYASNLALVQENQAEVDKALLDLNYCRIYAPIDGMTGLLKIDFGNLVCPCLSQNDPITTLNQMSPIFVTFSIPEFQLHRIQKQKENLKILAAYEDFTDEVFEGKLFMVNNSVDPNTGMITLRGIFENPTRALWPGQFIRTRLILYTIPDAVIIPYTAVQLTQKGPVVFVVKEDNTVDQRPIKLGQREDDQVIVLQGLKPNEKIVIEGQLNLFQGARIKP